MKYLLTMIIAMALLMGMPNATASSSDHVITYESTWDGADCRLIGLYGPYGIDGHYYKVSKLCRGNDGEYVIHYDIPVKYINGYREDK